MFQKIWDLLDGHKTDIVAGLAISGGVLILNGINIPVWIILVGAGIALVAIRSAIRKIEK